ncbi:MAG: sulfate adenylyltransferase [Ignavibacteria bacterium]|nr:sulfate adenylyltransferase [Ignavibacteria bacterium]MBT8391252.1 sulfate adenylyltransferase [Ignavibacteria bacterium]NNJ54303.1 sulfate adenylyltransferase [Ignavibacteriaceae bacterium]NNL22600.1 sulfate adenylyltransferase [Ignavibacteriaceae bacterium]
MAESKLINPHGSESLKILLLEGNEKAEELKKAETLPKLNLSSRETGDLIMMGIGGFTPLEGFMSHDDWKGVCSEMKMKDGLFWPIPITLSHNEKINPGTELCLVSGDTNEFMGTMKVSESYQIDKKFECKNVFTTDDMEHPGVKMVMEQKDWNIAGTVKVLSESYFPEEFKGIYQRPSESRKIFEEKGWRTIAALQLRNPMHRSHEYLAKIAIEVSDGLYIHQLVGKLKPGDIPADVRVNCINTLVENYFLKEKVVMGGYPLDMRYAGPREGLLHGVFRQNFGCSHMIIGRDHAGVGDYYGPFDAQDSYYKLWDGALECQMLPIDWTFWCYKCGGMASMKTCPHPKEDRLFLSGTALRKALSEGGDIPAEFSRPEVLTVLKDYYATLKEKVEVKMHGHATGDAEVKK